MKFQKLVLVLAVLLAVAGVAAGVAAAADDTRSFTDDFGRDVTLPTEVDKVLPSGALALSVLISYDPSYLASCGAGLPTNADKYLPELYAMNLPKTGGLLMSTSTVNYEEVMRLHELGVDVYIDAGQAKKGAAEALDGFTETTGLASVFISQNALDNIPDSYKKIGDVLGATERGEELYTYMKGWIDTFQSGMQKVEAAGKKRSAVQITSIDGSAMSMLGGYSADGVYGYQGTVINTLADNIVVAKGNKGTGDTYGMEEALKILLAEDPDVIFINGAADHAYYLAFLANPAFADLTAVKTGNVYEIPTDCPYLWTSQPFSGWGICGMIWMANILYPDVFNYTVKDKIQEFYKVMIGYDMSDAEYANLTATSMPASSPAPLLGILAAVAAAGVLLARRNL